MTHSRTLVFLFSLSIAAGCAGSKPEGSTPDSWREAPSSQSLSPDSITMQKMIAAVDKGDTAGLLEVFKGELTTSQRRGSGGAAILGYCASKGNVPAAAALIEAGADPGEPIEDGVYPLMVATAKGETKVMELFFSAGASPTCIDTDGTGLLLIAAANEQDESLELLLGKGADPDSPNSSGVTPLMAAAGNNDPQMVRRLIEAGADPSKEDSRGTTALLGAAMGGHVQALQELLKHDGAKKNLSEAVPSLCASGKPDALSIMLDAGADLSTKDGGGFDCVLLGAWFGHQGVVDTALKGGLSADSANEKGFTALMAAAANREHEVAKTLLASGADPSKEDHEKYTALSIALANGDRAMVDILSKNGVTIPPDVKLPSAPHQGDSLDLETPKACPQDPPTGEDAPFAGLAPISWNYPRVGERHGHGYERFSQVRSSMKVPVEVCMARGECEWLLELKCDDGSNPFENLDQAHGARIGSAGQGGRCGKIIDIYKVDCPEASYKIYMDMYHCSPLGD